MAGERRHLNYPGGTLPLGCGADLAAATKLAHELAHEQWQVALSTGFRTVAMLLGEPDILAKVHAVARQLLARRVLTGAEVDQVSAGAPYLRPETPEARE